VEKYSLPTSQNRENGINSINNEITWKTRLPCLAAAALSLPTFLLEQIVALETHHLGKKNKNKNKNPNKQ
jgi:hypothetical protein